MQQKILNALGSETCREDFWTICRFNSTNKPNNPCMYKGRIKSPSHVFTFALSDHFKLSCLYAVFMLSSLHQLHLHEHEWKTQTIHSQDVYNCHVVTHSIADYATRLGWSDIVNCTRNIVVYCVTAMTITACWHMYTVILCTCLFCT